MIFADYTETQKIYHIISMYDLKDTLENGINYDDKVTYNTKYKGFHSLIDQEKTEAIPQWVIRKKAIFGSLNYNDSFSFYSNSVVLGIKINPKKSWVANEILANENYAPFFLKEIEFFTDADNFFKEKGKELLKAYWETSLSFKDNLKKRMDKKEGYDAEILIFHNICPENIEIEFIISSHQRYTPEEWKKKYCEKN